jgi:hypothetical protein
MRSAVVCLVVCVTAGTAAAAPSNPAPASATEPPPAADPPLEFEAGRTAAQFALGAVAAGAPLIGIQDDASALVVMAATPALVGGVSCLIGRAGQHDGSCGATILGAYLGAAMIVPLGYIGYLSDRPQVGGPGGELYYGNAILGVALGWFLVQPLGATLGWHWSRSPRQPVTAGLPPRITSRLLHPPRRRDPLALRPPSLAPLVSLRF